MANDEDADAGRALRSRLRVALITDVPVSSPSPSIPPPPSLSSLPHSAGLETLLPLPQPATEMKQFQE